MIPMTKGTDCPLMIIDDSPEDCESLRRLFGKMGVPNLILFCRSGEEALHYLLRHGAHANPASSPRPGVILLDLNLPGVSGHDVLGRIKHHETLYRIPVVILSSSDRSRDVHESYRLGANGYIQKVTDLHSFGKTLTAFKSFWLDSALIPVVR